MPKWCQDLLNAYKTYKKIRENIRKSTKESPKYSKKEGYPLYLNGQNVDQQYSIVYHLIAFFQDFYSKYFMMR